MSWDDIQWVKLGEPQQVRIRSTSLVRQQDNPIVVMVIQLHIRDINYLEWNPFAAMFLMVAGPIKLRMKVDTIEWKGVTGSMIEQV